MKLDTAFENVRLWAEKASIRKRGFSVQLHVSPEGDVVIEKPVKIKDELEIGKLQNILFE